MKRRRHWLLVGTVAWAAACDPGGSSDTSGNHPTSPSDAPGFHASGRGDAPAGSMVLILREDAQPFTCNAESNGTYIAVLAKGSQAGTYTNATGSPSTMGTMQFQAIRQEIVDGQHLSKNSSTSGTLVLDGDATGKTLRGHLDVTFVDATHTSLSFATEGCDLDV